MSGHFLENPLRKWPEILHDLGFLDILVMLCRFSSMWCPFDWNWSYFGFPRIIWRMCGSTCQGWGGGIFLMLFIKFCLVLARGVTIRWATIWYISRYTTHDTVHDMIQNQLIYYQWKILKRCWMCHQYCYIKTVILARKSEFKINKVVYNHPCPRNLLLTNCICTQRTKIS